MLITDLTSVLQRLSEKGVKGSKRQMIWFDNFFFRVGKVFLSLLYTQGGPVTWTRFAEEVRYAAPPLSQGIADEI
jgi:hypothetical protein